MKAQGEVLQDRYRLGEVIGAGGMGRVMSAEDSVLQRRVAVKLLKPELASDPDTRERFRREARIAASLSHPGIAPVFDFGEDDGAAYIVMELLDGQDLHRLLADQGPLDPAAAAGIAAQAAEALEHAHSMEAVHRDVKPGNIFVTTSGAVKLTDFGIAIAASHATVTVTGAVIGTPMYLSPEQIRGERATASSDIYSLGCVLFQMLTGSPPFEAESSMAVAQAHLNTPAPSPSERIPSVPPELDAVVRKALEKEPGDRFASAGEMASALRAAGAGAAPATVSTAAAMGETQVLTDLAAPGPATPLAGALEDAAQPGRRRFPAGILILAGALVALILLAGELGGRRGEPVPDLRGKPAAQAEAEAAAGGFKVSKQERTSDGPAGIVLDQDPRPPGRLQKGETIGLVVAVPEMVEVPNVVGLTIQEATAKLAEAGFKSGGDFGENPSGIGLVVGQSPEAGGSSPKGSVITLRVIGVSFDGDNGKGRGKGKGKED